MNATEQLILKLDGRPMKKGKVHFEGRQFKPMEEQTTDERALRIADSIAMAKLPPSMRQEDEKEVEEEVKRSDDKKRGPRKGKVHIY